MWKVTPSCWKSVAWGNMYWNQEGNVQTGREWSGQIITTSADVTLNSGLIRELPQNPLNSGLGIILIWPEWWKQCLGMILTHYCDFMFEPITTLSIWLCIRWDEVIMYVDVLSPNAVTGCKWIFIGIPDPQNDVAPGGHCYLAGKRVMLFCFTWHCNWMKHLLLPQECRKFTSKLGQRNPEERESS